MKKQEFLSAKKRICDDIESINKLSKKLDSDYIESKKKYNIGDRVLIKTEKHVGFNLGTGEDVHFPETERYAYVENFRINYDGDLEYILLKEKKNGGKSLVRDYCGYRDKIVSIK